jgi:hypothetical protein
VKTLPVESNVSRLTLSLQLPLNHQLLVRVTRFFNAKFARRIEPVESDSYRMKAQGDVDACFDLFLNTKGTIRQATQGQFGRFDMFFHR